MPQVGHLIDSPNIISVETLSTKTVEEQEAEFVERKGLGHPDYIIDSVCEEASRALSKYYLDNFGSILHHNLDKGLLVGGSAEKWFGGGVLKERIYICIAGRATTEVSTATGVAKIPYGEIILEAAKSFIKNNFRFLDPEEHLAIEYKVRPGSRDLRAVVESSQNTPLANDTSFGVGFFPLSRLERLVLETEKMINSPSFKKRVPESGEDCKVMGFRHRNTIHLTVADGIVSSLTPDRAHYAAVKEQIGDEVMKLASRIAPDAEVHVYVNTADKATGKVGEDVVYLTFTGTSAENGDDGNTGRGNRANGLITPNRQMSLEATAGKNPVSHIGKTYNALAQIIAKRIFEESGLAKEVYVRLLSQIGKPVDKPLSASVQVVPTDTLTSGMIAEIRSVVADELSRIRRVTDLVLKREITLF